MSTAEILPGIYLVKGRFIDDFGFITSYLICEDQEVLVIDPGTAGTPGATLLDAIRGLGLNPRRNVIGIACTHGHPDHVGGAGRLGHETNAPVMIHEGDADLLKEPNAFVKKRLRLNAAQRVAMNFERGPLRVNYKGLSPDRILKNGDEIRVGSIGVRVVHTGGHSAGHCVFLDPRRKVLFSGDEVVSYPNEPRRFYVDLSGSLALKLAALDRLSGLGIEYLLPSHDIPHILDDIGLQFQEAKDGILHFQDMILTCLSARESADVEQLAFDLLQGRSLPLPTGLDGLPATTIDVALQNLERAGLVRESETGVWKRV